MKVPGQYIYISSGTAPWLAIAPPESALALDRMRYRGTFITADEETWLRSVINAIGNEFQGPQQMPRMVEIVSAQLKKCVEHWIREDRLRENFPIVYGELSEDGGVNINIRFQERRS